MNDILHHRTQPLVSLRTSGGDPGHHALLNIELPTRARRVPFTIIAGVCRVIDVACLIGATMLAGAVAAAADPAFRVGEFTLMGVIAIAAAHFALEQQGAYARPALLQPWRLILPLASSVLIGGVLSLGATILLHQGEPGGPHPTVEPLCWTAAAILSVLTTRLAICWHLQRLAREGRLATRVAVVGATAFSRKLVADLALDPAFTVIGIFDDRLTRIDEVPMDAPVAGTVDDLVARARIDALDAIVIALPLTAHDRIDALRMRLSGIAADIYLTPGDAAFRFAPNNFQGLGRCPVIAISPNPLRDWAAFKKAAFDRVTSAIMIVLLMPLLAAIALAIRLDSPGPVLFRQRREGLNGSTFVLLKFRSMRHRWQADDEAVQATRGDKRVTRVGSWLRRTSLDELPQLLNVLRGDMSLVGPRPHLPMTQIGDQTFQDAVPLYHARHRMKPGITGWAQVKGLRGETKTVRELVDRVAHDLHYIENWSLVLDVKILVGTVLREIVSVSGKAY